MAVSVAVPNRRPVWLNVRTAFGAALFLFSVVSGWAVLEGTEQGIRIWAAAEDLPSGVPLTQSDLVPVTSDLAPEQAALYLSADTPLDGALLTRPVTKGELLAADFVAPASRTSGSRAMTIPTSPEHAVGGDLSAGDFVDIYATLKPGHGTPRTVLVVASAQIVDVVTATDLMVDNGALTGLTVEVGPDDAAKLAHAIRTAELDVVKVQGEAVAASGELVTGGDL